MTPTMKDAFEMTLRPFVACEHDGDCSTPASTHLVIADREHPLHIGYLCAAHAATALSSEHAHRLDARRILYVGDLVRVSGAVTGLAPARVFAVAEILDGGESARIVLHGSTPRGVKRDWSMKVYSGHLRYCG